jgi:hypothetical protein
MPAVSTGARPATWTVMTRRHPSLYPVTAYRSHQGSTALPDIEVGRTGAGRGPVPHAGQPAAPPEQVEVLEVAVNEARGSLRRPLPQDAEGGLPDRGARRRGGDYRGGRIDPAPKRRRRHDLHIVDSRGHRSDLAQPALRPGRRDIHPAGQTRHQDGRVPVRFAAVRVSGYRLGRWKPGVMNGAKCRCLVRTSAAVSLPAWARNSCSYWRRTSTFR